MKKVVFSVDFCNKLYAVTQIRMHLYDQTAIVNPAVNTFLLKPASLIRVNDFLKFIYIKLFSIV